MEDLRAQQIEALQVAVPYSKKISIALGNVIGELMVERKPDTDEYVKNVINGLNWIFEVYNGTQTLLKENGAGFDKDAVNSNVKKLNAASNDEEKAEAFTGIKKFVDKFIEESEKFC